MTHTKDGAARGDTFAQVLREELTARGVTTALGHVNYQQFVKEYLPGTHYETLRKAIVGDRVPAPKLMEEVASALKIDPMRFAEYRLYEFSRQFDPREVGMEAALDALRRFGETGK